MAERGRTSALSQRPAIRACLANTGVRPGGPAARTQTGPAEESREERGEDVTEEDIWYAIGQDWLNDEVKALICKTIAQLPADVQEFAVYNCSFIDFGAGDRGAAYPA